MLNTFTYIQNCAPILTYLNKCEIKKKNSLPVYFCFCRLSQQKNIQGLFLKTTGQSVLLRSIKIFVQRTLLKRTPHDYSYFLKGAYLHCERHILNGNYRNEHV